MGFMEPVVQFLARIVTQAFTAGGRAPWTPSGIIMTGAAKGTVITLKSLLIERGRFFW